MKKILELLVTTLITASMVTPVFADGTPAPKPTDYPEKSITASSTESDAAPETDEETELTMWPVYLSLSTLGAMILVFVILNFADRKK